MKIIDISVTIDQHLPLWPNSSGLCLTPIARIGKKSLFNETHIEMNAHIGTHIDAPLHFIDKGVSIDKSLLDTFIGPAVVVDLLKSKEITVKDLETLHLPKGVKRILFKTSNSKLWKNKVKKFKKDYVGLTAGAATWLVKRGVKLVGIDYLSIAKMSEAVEVHRILLRKNVYILESINLTGVKPGTYELISLPLKISGAEAAPVRAILLK
ncbi:MAG: cyclase family protein [Candidatus Zambryskibacteria bacterium]|nr:cyclase family protein [Candidatus Zambryskibacteria bacterium]